MKTFVLLAVDFNRKYGTRLIAVTQATDISNGLKNLHCVGTFRTRMSRDLAGIVNENVVPMPGSTDNWCECMLGGEGDEEMHASADALKQKLGLNEDQLAEILKDRLILIETPLVV